MRICEVYNCHNLDVWTEYGETWTDCKVRKDIDDEDEITEPCHEFTPMPRDKHIEVINFPFGEET